MTPQALTSPPSFTPPSPPPPRTDVLSKIPDPGVSPLGGGGTSVLKMFWEPPWVRPSGSSPDSGVGPLGRGGTLL